MKLFNKNKTKDNSPTRDGEFLVKDYPKEDRSENFYFFEYCKPDGQWVEEGEPICEIKIGEGAGFIFKSGTVIASKSGFLEWILEKNCLLSEKMIFYKLHEKGIYTNENSIENDDYNHYYELDGYKSSFGEWLVTDGSFVNIGDSVYKYKDSKYNEFIHKAEKDGFIDLVEPGKIYSVKQNELLYLIRKDDNQRITEKYRNIARVIKDEFTQVENLTWERVSSKSKLNYGIVSKSDDDLVDLTFTLNYLQKGDKIVFHFNPKQIKPKQNDKISFLFDNRQLIEFILSSKPVSIKNQNDVKVLEYKSQIIKSELEIFSNDVLKKWKIDLINDNREILGGEKGSVIDYQSKENLKVVIKKFATDYISTVKDRITDYQAVDTREINETSDRTEDICFVYLMHDTANGYYKIGISNKPQYREKTLQSEKPTIELITAKKFPVRKIAESIEKSLHSVYAEKRLRGEWFELNEIDVENVIESLK